MRIGFIGVGDLAGYMVEGLARAGKAAEITLSPRGRAQSAALAERFCCAVAMDNEGVVRDSDLVVLAVRPDDAVAAVAGLPWRDDQVLVSVVAGATLDDLAVVRPATVVRSMPVSCAAIGESPTAIFPDDPAVRAFYEGLGTVVALPNEDVFAAASVMGAFHGWAFGIVATGTDWLVGQGVPSEAARALAAGMVRGSASVALASPERPLDDTLARLTTPGGITEAGFKRMEEVTGLAAWTAACDAALDHMS